MTETDAGGAHVESWRRPQVISGALLLGLFALLLVLISVDSTAGWLKENVDDPWHDTVASDAGSVAVGVSEVLAFVGRFPVSWLVWVAVVAVLAWQRRRREALVVALAAVAVHLGFALAKLAVARPRPPDPVGDAGGYAFPSGHAAWAAAVGVAIVLCLVPRRWRPAAWVAAAVFALAMAWSRTVLGVHWLTDVVAGVAWGAGVMLLVFGIVRCRSGAG